MEALQSGDSSLQIMSFVADQEVLADTATENFRIKCVQANYDFRPPLGTW
ncbi:hypothetical protein CDEST_10944 [Colletotrichum destructivum]|uniref:Uncharacterized protein n=1 Tax=Colletotrichum destructivum TaxID=34406 RepID=A0AAX4IRP6_9PEZI|nr:hypothetical protein CDEST_10944 [Colletotrichum destructivum]